MFIKNIFFKIKAKFLKKWGKPITPPIDGYVTINVTQNKELEEQLYKLINQESGCIIPEEEIKVHLYTFCFNEENIIPFAIQYWRRFATKVIVYDNGSTDNSLDLLKKEGDFIEIRHFNYKNGINDKQLKNLKDNIWKESRYEADFVVVCDMDEFLYCDDFYGLLKKMQTEDVHIARPNGYQLISENFPIYNENKLVHENNVSFFKEKKFDKCVLFNPNKVEEINYVIGAHVAHPTSKITNIPNLFLFHGKYLDKNYFIKKTDESNKRLSAYNIKYGLGVEYTLSKAKKEFFFDKMKYNSQKTDPSPLRKKIVIYTYLVGGYSNREMFVDLVDNLKHFVKFDYKILLVTDKKEKFEGIDNVIVRETSMPLFDTIKDFKNYALSAKFKLLFDNYEVWKNTDYVMFINSNLRFCTPFSIDFSTLKKSDIIGTTHFMTRSKSDYIQASFFVGKCNFLYNFLCPKIQKLWDEDLKNGTIAEWHDETYYNKIYQTNKKYWHLIDGYGCFELIDKTKFIGKRWDIHYNDIMYKVDEVKNTVFDITIKKENYYLKLLKNAYDNGFVKFKLYDQEKKITFYKNNEYLTNDPYFYHIPGEYMDYNELLNTLNRFKNNTEKTLFIYATK